jgi:predicted phage terminase large subunit-like protein
MATVCPLTSTTLSADTQADILARLRLNKYIPQFPTPKQAYALLLPHLEVFFGGSAGPGKMLDISTLIPTPDGWTRLENIQVGDTVFDEQGCPCQVTGVSDIYENPLAYRLTFDDQSILDACEDHEWLTFNSKELRQLTTHDPSWRAHRRANRLSRAVQGNRGIGAGRGHAAKPWLAERNRRCPPQTHTAPAGSIRTTREIYKTLRIGKAQRANHAIPLSAPLVLPFQNLLLDPYCLGAWLGDGTATSGGITGLDSAIWQAFVQCGFVVSHSKTRDVSHYVSGLLPLLRRLGVYQNKHIPPRYLRSSYAQRLALLQGLMDTDGHANRTGDVEFTSTNIRLAHDVHELIVSLGWKVRIGEGRAMLYGKDCGVKYRLNWTPSEYVFRSERKRRAQKLGTRRTTKFRYIVDCQPIPSIPMRCIVVNAPSHLYLAGKEMIPTHNSSWLLMSALQYVDIPGYAAVLFRRTFAELSKPDALMDRAHAWLRGTDAHWDGMRHTYRFPSGAQLVFSHLEHEGSKYEHQSAAYTMVAFDEASSFTETMYRYLFSRLRRLEGFPVPLRMRAASNPGNVGHLWLKQRFMVESDPSRAFVPARAVDNPYLDIEAYALSLAQLDPVTRARLRDGDWDMSEEGTLFQRHWFPLVEDWPQAVPSVRVWDFAATEEPSRSGREVIRDPDWTVGLRLSERGGQYWVTDMQRARLSPGRVEALVAQTAALDGRQVTIWIKQEPGSSGAAVVEDYQRRVLKGYAVQALRDTGPKLERMKPASSAAEAGNIFLVEGPWVKDFLDEVCLTAGTLIETEEGFVPIEHVRVGLRVWTRDGWRRVLKAELTHKESSLIILQAGMHILRGTSSHPVWVQGKGFIPLGTLQLGDRLLCRPYPHTYQPSHEKRCGIVASLSIGTLLPLIIEGVSIIAENGVDIIASCIAWFMQKKWRPFLKDSMSTIKMGILTIMPRQTLSHSLQQSIIAGTNARGPGANISVATVGRRSSHNPQPKSIIAHDAVVMLHEHAQGKSENDPVAIATHALGPSSHDRSFVVSTAQRWQCGLRRFRQNVSSSVHVLSARICSFLRHQTPNAVHVVAVSSLGIDPVKQPVYNLHIAECPEYFANGILVHNCLVGNPGVHDDIADCLATGVYVLSYGTKRAGTWGR